MKLLLIFIILISPFAYGEGISVKTELAEIVEASVRNTNIDINIPPNKTTKTSLEISTVNGLSVCSPEAEQHVKSLQREFIKSSNVRLTYSIYGAYLNTNGEIKYLPPTTESIKKLIGKCTNIYVSVY